MPLDTLEANGLLSALPSMERSEILERCELVRLEFGEVLSEPGQPLRHVYFPIEGFISQFAVPGDASNALEIGLVGSEGMYGVELALGVNERPLRCVVHGAGRAWRMSAAEFRRGGVEGDAPAVVAGDYLYVSSAEGAVTAGLQAAERLLRRLGAALGLRAEARPARPQDAPEGALPGKGQKDVDEHTTRNPMLLFRLFGLFGLFRLFRLFR